LEEPKAREDDVFPIVPDVGINMARNASDAKQAPVSTLSKGGKPSPMAWLLLVLLGFGAVMKDLSVFLLFVPEFDKLQAHEGVLTITQGGKRNSYLALDIGEKTVDFTCWISSAGISNCLEKEQRPLYLGKPGKVYSYRALINGIFHENRLLQLEVDGEVVISYIEQKEEYERLKHVHLYFHSWLVIPVLIWMLLIKLSTTPSREK
jgi:hypothetical protein